MPRHTRPRRRCAVCHRVRTGATSTCPTCRAHPKKGPLRMPRPNERDDVADPFWRFERDQ